MAEPMEEEELARFQDALAEALVAERDPEALKQRLLADARVAPFAGYVAGFDARCLEVTAALMRRWARRAPPAPEGAG